MNYSAMIENRKSVREFLERDVPESAVAEIEAYYHGACRRLIPEIGTALRTYGREVRAALEGSAGYENFLIGASEYLVLLTEDHPHAGENAGYIMEDLVLKLTEMGFDSCWITFADAARVKQALAIGDNRSVAAVVAFGYGAKTAKKLRVNILSMSRIDTEIKRAYYAPKRSVEELVYLDRWGNTQGVDETIGFYDDMLWQAFYAASLSPSYLNRQPYGFVLHDGRVVLVQRADAPTDEASAQLDLGIVMLHFAAVASAWAAGGWQMGSTASLALPAGYRAVAEYAL